MISIYGMIKDNVFTCENSNTYVYKKMTYKIACDGIVTNCFAIKQELLNKGYYFETCYDEEVILKAFIAYGLDSYNKFSGHFCIAIWSDDTNELILMRDYCSIKNLYYVQDNNGDIIFTNDLSRLLSFTYNEINYDAFVNAYLLKEGTNLITNDIKESDSIMLCAGGEVKRVDNKNIEYSCIFDEVAQIVLSNLNNISIVKLEDKSGEVGIVAEYILANEKMITQKKFSRHKLKWFLTNMVLPFYNLAEYNLAFVDTENLGVIDWELNKINKFYNMSLYNTKFIFPWYCREKIVGIDEVYYSDHEEKSCDCKDEKYIDKRFERLLKNKWINELNIKELDYYMKVYCIRLVNWMDKYNIRII